MQLPASTTDIEQAKSDLDGHGVCIMPAVLEAEMLQQAHAALYQAAGNDRTEHKIVAGFALDTNDCNQRVWNLLNRNAIFAIIAAHPTALALIRHVIGWPALLSNISGNIAGPGTTPGVKHADQVFVPQPWPSGPQGINIVWCLDDFSETNGATLVAPGSQDLHRLPNSSDEQVSMLPVVAPAGSIVAFESRVWHQTGHNSTADQHRAGVFAFYTTPVYRTQENWFLSLDPQVLREAPDDLLTLLAYKTEGFGLVNGRSPC